MKEANFVKVLEGNYDNYGKDKPDAPSFNVNEIEQHAKNKYQ